MVVVLVQSPSYQIHNEWDVIHDFEKDNRVLLLAIQVVEDYLILVHDYHRLLMFHFDLNPIV